MNTQNTSIARRVLRSGCLAAIGLLAFANVSSAVVVTFGETVPTDNIITSFDVSGINQGTLAWFNDGPTENGTRVVGQSFVTPSGSYLMDGITMKIGQTIAASFSSPSAFSIDFYRLDAAGENPAGGTYLSSQSGSLQPTTGNATTDSYFTFSLDTPLSLDANTAYGYVLAFTGDPEVYNLIRMAVSQSIPDPNGTRAWASTNGGGWSNSGETYAYYIQGTAIPEPGTYALLGLGVVICVGGRAMRKKVSSSSAA